MTFRAQSVIVLLAMAGCAHAPPPAPVVVVAQPGDSHPEWLDHLPTQNGVVYAVGICGPTYYSEDGIKNAGDKARAQLAYALSSHITGVRAEIITNDSSFVAAPSAIEAGVENTDAIVKNSEIISTWVDRTGSYSGNAGTTFALARFCPGGGGTSAPAHVW